MAYKNEKQYRLPKFDYAQPGYYFVTICAKNRASVFGKIQNAKMHLSQIGYLAKRFWKEIPKHFVNVVVDAFIVMPDHVHGIVIIKYCRNAPRRVPTEQNAIMGIHPLVKNSLSSIVNHYKGMVTKISRNCGYADFQWQPRFYDRVIRNTEELEQIREYIKNNPVRWQEGKESA